MPRKPGKERITTRIFVEIELDVDKSYSRAGILREVRESVELGINQGLQHVIAGDLNHKLSGTEAVHIIGYVRDWRVKNVT